MATAVGGAPGMNRETPLEEILKDFPPGPLDLYRKKASFDWKQMKLFIEGEDVLKFKVGKHSAGWVADSEIAYGGPRLSKFYKAIGRVILALYISLFPLVRKCHKSLL